MPELEPLDVLLSDAIRYLIAGGLPLEIVEEGGRQLYLLQGKEMTTDQVIAGAFLLGMGDRQLLN